MRNIINILVREYVERVRTKAFIILTVVAPLFIVGIFLGPVYFMARSNKAQHIAIVDLDGRIGSLVKERLLEKPKIEPKEALQKAQQGRGRDNNPILEDTYNVELIPVEPGQEAQVRARLSERVLHAKNDDDKLDAYVWIDKNTAETGNADYYARNTADFGNVATLEGAISRAVTRLRLQAKNISPDQVDSLLKRVDLRTVKITEGGEKEDKGIAAFVIPMFFTMLLYMTLLIYGATVMRSVQEEKSSRVFEVLLSSVKPIELMTGKIIGVAAVGLTQLAVWAVMFGTVAAYGLAAASAQIGDISVPPMLYVYFLIYFILGYLLFSSMYAAVGASANSDQEAQQMQMVILPFIIVPVMLLQMIIRNPSSPTAVAMSLIPFFTPLLMFLRISVQTPPVWQIALSIALLAGTTAGMIWICARIYRVGILMYGKRVTLPELVRWIGTA